MSVQAMARGGGLLFLITRILSARIPPVAFAARLFSLEGAPLFRTPALLREGPTVPPKYSHLHGPHPPHAHLEVDDLLQARDDEVPLGAVRCDGDGKGAVVGVPLPVWAILCTRAHQSHQVYAVLETGRLDICQQETRNKKQETRNKEV